MDAVQLLLEKHHLTTEEETFEFLCTNYNDVPEHELYLLIGAVAGVQYAANFHFIVEKNKTSRNVEVKERC